MSGAVRSDSVVIATHEQVQEFLGLHEYQPTTLNIPTMRRRGNRMFHTNIAFDDPPFDQRMAAQIDTVAVNSIERYQRLRQRDVRQIVLRLNQVASAVSRISPRRYAGRYGPAHPRPDRLESNKAVPRAIALWRDRWR